MFAPCSFSHMLLALLVLLSLPNTEARDLDLLGGGVQEWRSSDRVTRCPVHSKIQPVAADGGNGISFVVKAQSLKRFSLLEKYLPASGLQSYGGLQLNFTSSSSLGSWKLRLYDGQTNLRFAYIINKPDGAHSLTLPWSSFRAEHIRRCRTNPSGYSLQPSSISYLALWLPNGPEQAQLTIQGMHAMGNLSETALTATFAANGVTAEGFNGPFVGMGISGHNDFAMIRVNMPAECADACKKTANCRSFDYGARGQVIGECWLSLADRKSAGNAYESWELYDYYEIEETSPDAATTKATGNPETETALSKDDMAAVMEYFDGPFVGMGITGHNDFAVVSVNDPAECADACTKTANCRSFDYGSREYVVGECWLSLADRKSAGDAYRSWPLYNYYEIKATANTDNKNDATKDATSMQGAKKDETAAGTKGEGTNASHAQRLLPKPMACVPVVGALLVVLAL